MHRNYQHSKEIRYPSRLTFRSEDAKASMLPSLAYKIDPQAQDILRDDDGDRR